MMLIKLKVKVIFTLRLNTCHNDFLMLDCVFLSSRAKRKDSSVIFIYFAEVQSKIAFCVLISPVKPSFINPCIEVVSPYDHIGLFTGNDNERSRTIVDDRERPQSFMNKSKLL